MNTPEDADSTQIKNTPGAGGAKRADLFGEYADALPAGTRLHEFELISVVGQGGFGIVYLAHDLTLDRNVAIKEYMPSALATRTQAMTVAVRSARHADTFKAGLRSFINEARLLAQFDHPSLLKVHRFWEAHGTAYMVMPYYAGTTLAKTLPTLGGPPDEAWLKALLHPLLHALELMHGVQCYHRDIAPDNILILPDGRPLLLDFGAARRVISNMTKALTVILKTGYAPVEQYGELPDMAQGPWTDLYALGSVVQFAITGHTPPQAVARFLADKRELLVVTAAGRYSGAFLTAIDRSLAVLPKDRPQSVAEMREMMEAAPIRATAQASAAAAARTSTQTTQQRTRSEISPAVMRSTMQRTQGGVAANSGYPPTAAASTNWQSTSPTSAPAVDRYTVSRQAPGSMQDDDEPGYGRRALVVLGVALLVALVAALTYAGFAWLDVKLDDLWKSDSQPASPTQPTPAVAPQAAPTSIAPAPATPPAPTPTKASTTAPTAAPPSATQAETPTTVAPAPAETTAPATVPAAAERQPAVAPEATPRLGTGTVRQAAPRQPPQARETPRIPRKKLPNERCADIIQRASLGEEPTAAEKTYLKQECGQ